MPKSKGKTSQRSDRKNNRKGAGSARFEGISKSTAHIVKDAAALLDEELAAGIVAANQVQRRFRKDRRVDPADFSKALQRFQTDQRGDYAAQRPTQRDAIAREFRGGQEPGRP